MNKFLPPPAPSGDEDDAIASFQEWKDFGVGSTKRPKAHAKIYIDDAALGCQLKKGLPGERPYVDWDVVELLLFGNNE